MPDSAKKTLHIVSAYINKKDTFSDVLVSNDPKRYVQDEHRSNVSSKDIISDSSKKSSNIRYSLSQDNLGNAVNENVQRWAKNTKAGDYRVYGKDISLDIPTKESLPVTEESLPIS